MAICNQHPFGPSLTVMAIEKDKGRKISKHAWAAQDETSVMKAMRVKFLYLILLILAGVFIFIKIWDSDYIYAYRQYFFHSKDQINLDFNRLEPMSAAIAEDEFKLNLYCQKNQSQFGDYVCDSNINQWNNIPAMSVVFWFRNGILTYAKIDVPPWRHETLIRYIHLAYGDPYKYSARINIRNILAGGSAILKGEKKEKINEEVNDLGIWHMDTGAILVVNVKKEFNPLLWNTVFWISPDVVKSKQEQQNLID